MTCAQGFIAYHYQLLSLRCRCCVGRVLVREGQVPVGGCEAGEGADEGEEDDEEDDVGAEGTDEEDKADQSWPFN